jgi:hypothetical protein
VAPSPQTLPTSGGRSVGIVRSRTQATEFFMGMILHSPKDEMWTLMIKLILRRNRTGSMTIGWGTILPSVEVNIFGLQARQKFNKKILWNEQLPFHNYNI